MNISRNDDIFKYRVNYSGLVIELISGSRELQEINFVKDNKKINANYTIPEPVKKTLLILKDYFNGVRSNIELIFRTEPANESLPDDPKKLFLDMSGYTEKELRIYKELTKVMPGKTVSYGDLAMRSGIPRGARFAGNCMAGNRFPIIIPCHRVIKKDGSIGNYSGGAEIKEFLLKHETGIQDVIS